MKQIDRIFTFGCSWTKHWWPTWSDIIRYSVNVPVYNWGLGGIGNVAIFHRLLECDLKNKFTDRDLIIVQWSSWTREDRFLNSWMQGGNVFSNPDFDKIWLEKYWSWDNDVIKNCTAIISANRMFDIKFQTTMIPIATLEHDRDKLFDSLVSRFYIEQLPKDIVDFPNNENSYFYNTCIDTHPDPMTHLFFYEKILRNKLNYLPSCDKFNQIKDFQSAVSRKINKSMNFEKTKKNIMKFTNNFDPYILNTMEGF